MIKAVAVEQKQELRQQFLQARKGISDEDREVLSQQIIEHILAEFSLENATVALYHSIHGEVDVTPLAKALRKQGTVVALPKVSEDGVSLTFRCWKAEDALFAHPHWGMMEPFRDTEIVTPDYVFVPSVAVDRSGVRLGYGKGVYDNVLAQLPNAKAVGCVYESQVADQLPQESHDHLLDYIATEKGVFSCKS